MKNKNHKENTILKTLLLLGILAFINVVRKPPVKDWLIIFLFKSYISTFFDRLTVKKGYITYPVKLIKWFDISFIFDYLLFPLSCVYYNQMTYKKNFFPTVFSVFLFSIPMSLVETMLEKNTKLVSYKKGWNSFHSFFTLTITFLFVRVLMEMIRYVSKNAKEKEVPN